MSHGSSSGSDFLGQEVRKTVSVFSSLLYFCFSFGFLGLSAFWRLWFGRGGGVTWTQPCNCQFNHRPLPRIYNKEREKELSFMSHFLLQKRSITVYKSQLYRIMWQKAWLMHSFEELRITLWEISSVSYFHHYLSGSILNIPPPPHLDKSSAAARPQSDATETKSGIERSRRPNFQLRRNFENLRRDPKCKFDHMLQKSLLAKTNPAGRAVKNRHGGNLEMVQVCCWLAPHGRSIETSIMTKCIYRCGRGTDL